MYISNEKKHNESLTMSEAGLIKDCLINIKNVKIKYFKNKFFRKNNLNCSNIINRC